MGLHEYIGALNTRQQMTLLSALTFGGQDALGLFDHLPEGESELLRGPALQILEIPRTKRVSLLVREMKRLIGAQRTHRCAADPDRLIRLLCRERPALLGLALRALPAETADALRTRLPASSSCSRAIRPVKPEILEILRWKLEEAAWPSER